MANPSPVRAMLEQQQNICSDQHLSQLAASRGRRRRKILCFLAMSFFLLVDLKLEGFRALVGNNYIWNMPDQAKGTSSFGDDGIPLYDPREEFDWASMIPSRQLKWTQCYDRFQCARLDVPLDYSFPSGERAAVALIRLPSPIPAHEEGHRGPVLFNPGGPGGSGVQTILLSADGFRSILGDGFDIVGFDPRGVGKTTPTLTPFATKSEAGSFFMQVLPNINASDTALGNMYAHAKLLGELFAERAQHTAQHVSTPTVARDMLSIVKAHGREKLQYWGFSYGTVLGATFVSMFPDKIERMLLDGVLDAETYYSGQWTNRLKDSNATLFDLYNACVKAGPERCALYEDDAARIHERIDRLLNSLKLQPIPFHSEQDNTYAIVDFASAKSALFEAMYATHLTGEYITDAFARLEQGDAHMIWKNSERRMVQELLACNCSRGPSHWGGPVDTLLAIACGEREPIKGGIEELKAQFERTAKTSYFADSWYTNVGCAGWKVRTKVPFKGSFSQNTSYPILFIGNTADPVTPLISAYKMAQRFNGSVVLTQDSPGHCSTSAVSLCTAKHVRQYFQEGSLPAVGTKCGVESSIFGPGLLDDTVIGGLDSDDRELLVASRWLHLSNGMHSPFPF